MTKEKFETYLRTYNLPSKFEKFVNDDNFMKYQIGRILYYSKEPLNDLTIKSIWQDTSIYMHGIVMYNNKFKWLSMICNLTMNEFIELINKIHIWSD